MHGPQILPRLRAGTQAELIRITQGHLHNFSIQVPPAPGCQIVRIGGSRTRDRRQIGDAFLAKGLGFTLNSKP